MAGLRAVDKGFTSAEIHGDDGNTGSFCFQVFGYRAARFLVDELCADHRAVTASKERNQEGRTPLVATRVARSLLTQPAQTMSVRTQSGIGLPGPPDAKRTKRSSSTGEVRPLMQLEIQAPASSASSMAGPVRPYPTSQRQRSLRSGQLATQPANVVAVHFSSIPYRWVAKERHIRAPYQVVVVNRKGIHLYEGTWNATYFEEVVMAENKQGITPEMVADFGRYWDVEWRLLRDVLREKVVVVHDAVNFMRTTRIRIPSKRIRDVSRYGGLAEKVFADDPNHEWKGEPVSLENLCKKVLRMEGGTPPSVGEQASALISLYDEGAAD